MLYLGNNDLLLRGGLISGLLNNFRLNYRLSKLLNNGFLREPLSAVFTFLGINADLFTAVRTLFGGSFLVHGQYC